MRKFTFTEVVSETDESLIESLRSELPKKPLRSGADMRVNTLRTLVDLIEKQNKKLSEIHDLLVSQRR